MEGLCYQESWDGYGFGKVLEGCDLKYQEGWDDLLPKEEGCNV